jgi:hypothetical protein
VKQFNSQALPYIIINSIKEIWAKMSGYDAKFAQMEARLNTLEGHGNTPSNLPSNDTTAPVVTVIGEEQQTVAIGVEWSDLGATASDNVGTIGNTMASVNNGAPVVAGSVVIDTSAAGDYFITYTASDAAGNIGTATRTVHVQ